MDQISASKLKLEIATTIAANLVTMRRSDGNGVYISSDGFWQKETACKSVANHATHLALELMIQAGIQTNL